MIENNTSLKVVTWNIKGGAALGWNNKYTIRSEAVDKILEQKADFIVLTEFVLAKGLDYLLKNLWTMNISGLPQVAQEKMVFYLL